MNLAPIADQTLESISSVANAARTVAFESATLLNEMESKREVNREDTAFCLGRERRTQQRCKTASQYKFILSIRTPDNPDQSLSKLVKRC